MNAGGSVGAVPAIADLLVPGAWRRTAGRRALVDLALVLGGSLVVALSARISFLLPFTPVPVTGQTLAVLLVGAALGSRRGSLAMVAYLAEGAAGAPVFFAGSLGIAHLLGPTAGYLWSYPLVAGLVGALAERGWDRSPWTAGLAMLAGNAVIYLFALPWLAFFVGREEAVAMGLAPFVAGDLIKIVLAALLLPAAWSLIGRLGRWAGSDRG